MVKQKVQGTTLFVGLIRIHELYTAESVLSNACNAYFSQYSTAEGSLINYSIALRQSFCPVLCFALR